jgi:hypothetical protein
MAPKRLKLNEVVKQLMTNVDSFGDCYVSSFGYSIDRHYVVIVCDEQGRQTHLKIPMYENMEGKSYAA